MVSKHTLKFKDLNCYKCAEKIKNELLKISYISQINVDVLNQKLDLELNNSSNLDRKLEDIKKLCVQIEPEMNFVDSNKNTNNKLYPFTFGIFLFIISFFFKSSVQFSFLICFISYILIGSNVLKKTLFNLKGKFDYKMLLWDLLYDIAGSILYAAGIYTFAGNAGFAPGGVSGLALILNHLLGLPVGMVTLLFNIPLVVISYKAVGKALLIKSAKTMVISSLFLDVIFPFIPMYTGSRLMAAICSGVFMGAGMALFYIRGSSSGGIDFLALTIKKKKPHMTIGVITLLIDLVVILLGWPVFGDVDAVLYGVASTVVSTIVIDKILYGTGAGTLAIIITEKGSQIGVKIGENVRRGVTMIPAEGGYTGMRRDVILCACSKAEAYLVKSAVQEADEKAFVMFTETSEVFGEGFKTEIK